MQYKVGDQIDIRVEVIDDRVTSWGTVVARTVGYAGDFRTNYKVEELDAGKLVPREIKVGDRVRSPVGMVGTTVALHEESGAAWVRYDGCEVPATIPVRKLELVR